MAGTITGIGTMDTTTMDIGTMATITTAIGTMDTTTIIPHAMAYFMELA